jgi:molecular chaperone IbpA
MTDAMLRHFLGFDPVMFKTVEGNYPRYNIVREESADRVSVEIAVPGFGKDDVSVEQDGNKLIIKAKPVNWLEDGEEYLHKGFSSKAFEKDFILGEFMEVDSVRLQDGVLVINVVKNIPEDKRPKIFDIE